MFIIIKAKKTCFACPSLWEIETYNGQHGQIRCRHGNLTLTIGLDTLFQEYVPNDGVISFDEVKQHMASSVIFMCEETGMNDDVEYDEEALLRFLEGKDSSGDK